MIELSEKLDLDLELLNHLAVANSIVRLREQEFHPKLIMDEGVRAVYTWQMEHVREEGCPATRTVLEDEWGVSLKTEQQTSIGDLIARMRKRYVRSEGKTAFRDILKDVEQDPLKIGPRMLTEGKRLAELTTKRGKKISQDDWDLLQNFYESESQVIPASWGWPELDSHFGGIRGLVFLLARMKSFKSWFTVHTVLQNIKQGRKTVLYSLEMPVEHTAGRLACLNADIPFNLWERGSLTQHQEAHLKASYSELRETGVFNIEKPPRGSRSVRELLEKALDQGAEFVAVDQLQYLELDNGRSSGSQNNTGDYWDVCEALRDYSDRIPILCIHQFNRSTLNNHKTNERPDPQQAKGSAAVEETANTMIGLWQNKAMRQGKYFEVYTLAARSAVEGAWTIHYELGKGCRFEWGGESQEGIEI